jgi:ribosome-binding protein aMBF1 (putative translation factor)
MTREQCRDARERLDWARLELAAATNVPGWFIAAFEDGKTTHLRALDALVSVFPCQR